MNLKTTLAMTMILVGVIIGIIFTSQYSVPVQRNIDTAHVEPPGYRAFVNSCSTCHTAARAVDYHGPMSWLEVIVLMQNFGAFISEDDVRDIEQYLEENHPIAR